MSEKQKKRYYEQAFQFVESVEFDDKTRDKDIEWAKSNILKNGYTFEEYYGLRNRISATMFPYTVDIYNKLGDWSDDFYYNGEGTEFVELTYGMYVLSRMGYDFKIDIDDLLEMRALDDLDDFDRKIIDKVIERGHGFEGDCDYAPNFDVNITRQEAINIYHLYANSASPDKLWE